MKKVLLFVFAVMMSFFVSAQTIVFQENFESTSIGLTTTADSAGFPTTSFQAWAASTNLYHSGVKADSNVLQTGKTIYLTSSSFATTGNTYVVLEFSQICKLYFADGGIIEISNDGGTTWTPLGATEYQGSGNLITSGGVSKFSDNAYTDWAAGGNTIPTNSWWKNEKFDISTLAANKTSVKIRFKYTSSGQPTGAGRYGWLLDDIKITASPSELNPPSITMISYPIDTVYSSGPYQISAYVKDNSGIDTVYALYKIDNGAFIHLGLSKSPTVDSLYSASIPFPGWGKKVTYNITARDASGAHNLAYRPTSGYYSFFVKYSNGGTVIIGTGTATQSYPFYTYYGYATSASLYLGSEIANYGLINQLQWNVGTVTSDVIPIKIYIKQTTLTSMTADTWANMISGATLVYDGTQIFNTAGWKSIALTTPFNYSSGNILVLCETNYGGAGTSSYPYFTYTTAGAGTHQYQYQDNTPPTTVGLLSTSRPNIKITVIAPSTLTQDVGVNQIIYPTGGVTANQMFNVSAKIKNYGTALLTKAVVKYSIDGGNISTYFWQNSLGLAKDSISASFVCGSNSLALGGHSLKIWSELPNDSLDQNSINDTLHFAFYACDAPLSGIYTVGGATADFPTLGDVYTSLTQCGINGPVQFYIAPDTYSDQLTFPPINGASDISTITFKSATNDSTSVIMNHTSTAAANWIVKFDGADYITFKNIKFAPADSANSTAVVFANGAINNVLEGNLFVGYNGNAAAQTLISIDGSGTNMNNNNLIKGNYIKNGSYAISAKGNASVKLKNTVIKNNTIDNSLVYGIYAQYVDSTLIDSNTVVSSITNSASKFGIYLQYADISIKITKNTVSITGGTNMYGILTESCNATSTAKGLIANNFVSVLNGTNYAYGIRLNTTIRFNVYNNSVITNGNNNTDTRAINIVSTCTNTDIKNNNLQSNKYPIFIEGASSVSSSNYNNYYATGTSFAYYNATPYANLPALIAASFKDSSSITVNPYFLSLTNLHTFNGLLKGMGTTLPEVTIDIDGAPRLSPPCIGADEFLPPAQDATLITILKPVGGCGLTTTEDVKVVIKNVGSGIILPNAITARYKIDSINPVVSELVNRTLNPGDTIQFLFATKANLAVPPVTFNDTTYKIKAWTDLAGDFAYANDSSNLITMSSMYLPLAPTVTNGTTLYATSITLNAVSNRPIVWYHTPTTSVSLHTGPSYTTPILLATDTFYVESKTSQSFNAAVGTGTASQTYPFYAGWGYTTSASIYNASEIGAYGMMNTLQWNVVTTAATVLPIKIYLKQTTLTSMTADTWANMISGATLVYDGTQTFSVAGWKSIALNTPFNYTSGNLMVLCEANYGGTGTTTPYFQYTTAGTGTHQYSYADNAPGTGTGYLSTSRPNIKLSGNVAGCVSPRVPIIATVTVPAREAGLRSIIAPTGCALYQVPISVKIFNHGTDTLKSTNTTVKYKIDNGSFITPEAINVVIPPYDTVQYTFTALADFTAPTVDRFIKVTAIVNTPNDAISANDTLVKDSVLSRFTPPSPVANNVNIFNGSTATLTATASNGNIKWYDLPIGGTPIGQGSPFTTPFFMYFADTFYVEANTNYSASATLGTGVATNTNTGYPAPYGNFYWGAKHQILITKAELNASGIQAGPITSLAFDVATAQGVALQNFVINMGHTPLTAMVAGNWITGLTPVYSAASYTDVVGWNTHTFTTPFVWNGIDNVVAEVCFNNSSYTYNGLTRYTPTTFNSVAYRNNDAADVCTQATSVSVSMNRPNIKLDGMVPGCASARVPVIVTVSPPPQNDAGVIALVNPMGSTPSGVATPIQVKIKNFGQAPLTSATVAWTLNGVAKPNYSFTGHVPTNTDTTITIATETFSGGLYCVKSWTKNPNGAPIDSIASNDTLFSTCFTACLNGSYTIGDTTGGNYHNFPTFNAAVTTLKIAGVCGNVTFLVDTGTYNEQVRIPQINGSSAVNTITFRSASNDSTKVKLQYAASTATNYYTLQLDSADYITFRAMTIKAAGTTYGRVIELINNATNNTFANNRIEMPVTTSSYFYGIYDYGSASCYNKYQNNIIMNGYYGIYNYGTSTTSLKKKNEFIGNKVMNFYYYGIYSYYQDSVKYIGNEINSNSTSTYIYGFYTYYNQNASNILKNKIILNTPGTQYGLYVYYMTGTATAHGLVANNMVALSGGNATSTNYGMYVYSSNYQDIYYNSISVAVPSPTYGRALYHYGGTFINFVNNNIVNTGGGMAYYISTPTAITQSNYNNIYTTGSILGYWTANKATLADLQAASSKDANSVSVNPMFTSATDLHLLSTGLSTLATPIIGITDDIDGYTRDTLHPTIGADEVPLLAHDAGVTFISRPNAVEIENASFQVKVAIKNFGIDPITSMTVSYKINNGTPVDYTYTGNLLSMTADTVTFPANMTVLAGNNSICAYTSLAGDSNLFNNQTCKNYWGTPLYDAQIASISPIPGGCGLTNDTVKVLIVNQGIMPIHGGLTVSYTKLFGGVQTSIVTETVSDSIPVNSSFLYKFNTLVNLAVTTHDSIYRIKAWATLTNDNIHGNDTNYRNVQSLHTPPLPTTANVTIPYATTASLTATSITNDPLKWYDSITNVTSLHTGSPFVTPILFATDTFYVEANTSYSALATIGTGTATNGTSGYPAPYGNYWWGAKHQLLITKAELNANGIQAGPINSIAFDVAVVGGAPLQNFEIKAGHTTSSALSTGSYITNLTSVYTTPLFTDVVGWNTHTFTTPFVWNGIDNIIFETCFNNASYTTCAQMRYTTYTYNCSAYSYGDNATNCGNASSTYVSMNRPNIKILGMVPGCSSSPRLPAIVNVGAQPALDASALSIITPVTGVNLSSHDTVRVRVKNYGYSTISNFPVKYKLGNNPVVSQIMTDTILTDSVKVFTFSQTVNLSSNTQPQTFNIVAWTDLVGDPTHQNDTTKKTVINNPPVYCISAATYTGDEDLGQVIFAGINHGNSLPVMSNPTATQQYNNYTDTVGLLASIQPGMTYPISLSVIYSGTYVYSGYSKVFIDYNRDGDFEDAGEVAFEGAYDGTTISTLLGNVTVPYTAIPGFTRMRITVQESGTSASVQPCNTYYYGETEDYKVSIIPPIPHDGGMSKIGIGTFIPYSIANPVSPYFYIRNYGSDSLSTANINYKVNNGTLTTHAWTPSSQALQSLQIDSVQLAVNLNYGVNTITTYTNGIVGDTNYPNDTLKVRVFKEYSTTPPYADNFEVNKYWFATDTVNGATVTNLWEQGIPTSTSPSLNAAHSPVNVWATKLSGNYVVSNNSVLYTPVFDIQTMIPDTLKFWQWRQFGTGANGFIEYKNASGAWVNLGVQNDTNATNWYNNVSNTWNLIDTVWKQSKYRVKNLTNLGTTVQFRFIFSSTTATPVMKGWAIDDFELTLAAIPQDGGVVAITSPAAISLVGDNVPVTITVRNFGTDILNNVPVRYQVGTGAIVTGILTGPIMPGATAPFTFTQNYQVGIQSYTICAYTEVVGDVYVQNNKICKLVTVNPAANDVGITEILNPGLVVSTGGGALIKVVIKNFGTQTQTSIPLTYRRGTVTAIDATWSGSLASGDTVQYTFATPMAIPSGTSFAFASYTRLANDAYMHNDTASKSVLICGVPAAGAITGPTTVTTGSVNTYSISSLSTAVSYNWVYTPAANVTIVNNGTSATITFGAGSLNGVLTVNGVGATCSGTSSSINIGGLGVNEVDPNSLWLGQNLPNPTSGLTNIEYNIPTSGEVKFDIMNLFGQKVYSSIDEKIAGRHLIDLNVDYLSDGVYYYTIEFKGKRLVNKMLITK
ncbi:MAG: GEVED domain-containing protein [Bacteroidales bacterium]